MPVCTIPQAIPAHQDRRENMSNRTRTGAAVIAVAAAAMFVRPATSVGRAEPDAHKLTCGPERTIGAAIKTLKPGDTLLVSGVCHENVTLGEEVAGVTLDGQGAASIDADQSANVITVTGRGITIRGFTISGGAQAVAVVDGGSAIIDGNTIQNAAMIGVAVFRNSTAEIINNTIQNNANAGIALQSNASARIGFLGPPGQRISAPNTIQNNGGHGIRVYRGSSAMIISNTIQNNASHGIIVDRNAQAEIFSCLITGNGGDAIRGMRNASLDLGSDVNGSTPQIDDDTNTGTNAGFAVRCTIGGSVDGRLGALIGILGPKSFTESCVDSVMP
jgi:parallel beta-helix repeat protein